jgi:predicted urease superfamily metal-dependent hydrolase
MKPLPMEEAIVEELEALKHSDGNVVTMLLDKNTDAAISIIRKHIAALKVEDIAKQIHEAGIAHKYFTRHWLAIPDDSKERYTVLAQSIMSLIRSE